MSEQTSGGQTESSERRRPSFEPVSATVPTDHGDAQALAYRLTSGEFQLGSPIVPGADIRPGERVIQYVRSDDAIIRIEPDGRIKRLDLDALKAGRIVVDEPGYVSGVTARNGSPLSGITAMNPYDDGNGHLLTNMWETTQLTKKPVTEVLVRTSRRVPEGKSLPTTDTPARFGTPRQFIGR